MASVNKATILGRMGKNPETTTTQGGMIITKFSIATSENFKKGDEWQEKTEWHNIITFGKTAEHCEKYLKKGMEVYLEGKIQTSNWTNNAGVKQYKTEINAREIKIISKKENNDNYKPATQNTQQQPKKVEDAAEDSLPF